MSHAGDGPDRGGPPERPPSDELVLAAIERAARHRARDTPAVPIWAIAEHLALPRRSARGRRLRAQLERLVATGALEPGRRRGVPTWALSARGRRRLRGARLAGQAPMLPESPQHLAWRNAQTLAACEIERFRRALADGLEQARRLLDAQPPGHSDAWFELGERLHRDARRLGSASHCLREWPEPQDERADLDERSEPGDERLAAGELARVRSRRVGRRNVSLWDERRGRA